MPRAASGQSGTVLDIMAGRLGNIEALADARTYSRFLTIASVVHPEFSQAVHILSANANQGHTLAFDAPDGAKAEALIRAGELSIQSLSDRVHPHGGGIEGLINSYNRGLAVDGAISSEDIVSADRRRVEEVAFIPTYDLDFQRDPTNVRWLPYQRAGRNGRTMLNERTFRYYGADFAGNNPFAIPPFLSAVNAMLDREDMDEQTRALLRKMGHFGILALMVKKPDYDGLDEDQKQRAYEQYLGDLATKLGSDFRNSITVMEEGAMKLEFMAQPATSAAGANELLRTVEERMFSGLKLDPALFGKTWAKTETWLGVAITSMEAFVGRWQRLTGLRISDTFRLQLALEGIPLACYVEFAKMPRMRPNEQAMADSATYDLQVKKATQGLITFEEAARRLGEATWADMGRAPQTEGSGFGLRSIWAVVKEMLAEGAVTSDEAAAMLGLVNPWSDTSKIGSTSIAQQPMAFKRYRFAREDGRYRYQHAHITTLADVVGPTRATEVRMRAMRLADRPSVQVARLAAPAVSRNVDQLQRLVATWSRRYAGKLGPAMGDLQWQILEDLKAAIKAAPEGAWKDEDEFGRWALDQMSESFRTHWKAGAGDEVLERVSETHGDMYKAWREDERGIFAGQGLPEAARKLGPADTEAMRALAANDSFHLSVYLEHLQGAERKAVENMIATEFLALGRDISDPDVMDDLLVRLERSGALLMRRRDHGREGGEASETDQEAMDRLSDRMRRIVNTTVQRSQVTSSVYAYDTAGIEELEFVATGSSDDPDEICNRMNGKRIKVGRSAESLRAFYALSPEEQEQWLTDQRGVEPSDDNSHEFMPPLHPHCFPGNTPVSGSFVAGIRMAYSGPMVSLSVDGCEPLSVTPNHPILTTVGFIPAGLLCVGDEALCDSAVIDGLALHAGDDVHEAPATIEQVFDALSARGLVGSGRRGRVAPDALHGDARFGDGHVEVVGAARELLGDVSAESPDGIRDGVLVMAAMAEAGCIGDGSRHLGLVAVGPSALSRPRSGEHAAHGVGVATALAPSDPANFGRSADLDAVLSNVLSDGRPADAGLSLELQRRYAGRIAPRKVIDVSQFDFSGHVFDLKSSVGYLTARGIVASNCACDTRAVL